MMLLLVYGGPRSSKFVDAVQAVGISLGSRLGHTDNPDLNHNEDSQPQQPPSLPPALNRAEEVLNQMKCCNTTRDRGTEGEDGRKCL